MKHFLKSIVSYFTPRDKGDIWGGEPQSRTIDEVLDINLAAGRLVVGW